MGHSRPKKKKWDEFFGFPFWLIYPRLGVEKKTQQPRKAKGHRQNKQKLAVSSKRTRKGAV